jgi:hypothetical protein
VAGRHRRVDRKNTRMIFTTPCCDDLRSALTAGEDRVLRLLHGAGSPLVLSSHSVWGEAGGKPAKGRVMAPVYFCPFCGTRLQTREAVKALAEKPKEPK